MKLLFKWTVGKNPSYNSKQISIMAQDTQVLQKCLKTTISLFVPTNPISPQVSFVLFRLFFFFLFFFKWTLDLAVLSTDRPCDTPKLSWLKSRRPFIPQFCYQHSMSVYRWICVFSYTEFLKYFHLMSLFLKTIVIITVWLVFPSEKKKVSGHPSRFRATV